VRLEHLSHWPFRQLASRFGHWHAFYIAGKGFTFRDRSGREVQCQGGPPVLTQGANGDGWAPGVKRVGWAQGTGSETSRCYGDRTGKDLNGDYQDVCPERDAWVPRDGDEWLWGRIKTYPVDIIKDVHLLLRRRVSPPHYYNDDLEPGSRNDLVFNPSFLGSAAASGNLSTHQFASGTFFPVRSALDQACQACPSALHDVWTNRYSATHGAVSSALGSYNMPVVEWLLEHLQGRTPTTRPRPEICGNGVDEDLDGADQACLSAWISGPTSAPEFTAGTWSAHVAGGTPPYRYEWYVENPDTGNRYLVGTGPVVYYPIEERGRTFWLTLVVTDAGGATWSTTISVYATGGGGELLSDGPWRHERRAASALVTPAAVMGPP
jgi:hypothetical protein